MTSQQFFNQFLTQMTQTAAPAKQASNLFVDHIEKLAKLQLDAAASYTGFGIEQLRAALSVTDVEGLQNYVQSQAKVVEAVGQKFAADAKTVVELNQQLVAEVQQLAQQSAQAATVAVKPAGRKAA